MHPFPRSSQAECRTRGLRAREQVALILPLAQPLSTVHPPPATYYSHSAARTLIVRLSTRRGCLRPDPSPGVFLFMKASRTREGFLTHSSSRVRTERLLGVEDGSEGGSDLQLLVLPRYLQKYCPGCSQSQSVLVLPPCPQTHTLTFPGMNKPGLGRPFRIGVSP